VYLASGFIAYRSAATDAASQARHILDNDRFAEAWDGTSRPQYTSATRRSRKKADGSPFPPDGCSTPGLPHQ
jgi:hypothetical protein